MERLAWILTGGWDGHQPRRMAEELTILLKRQDFRVRVVEDLGELADARAVAAVDLIVPNWTNGTINPGSLDGWLAAVRDGGTGVAGLHGGMADAFRAEPAYHEMVGGQWVAHPGGDGVTYTVRFVVPRSPLTEGLPDFAVTTEQYYLHVDPAVTVLATTDFGEVAMPVAWTKRYGAGRIFYCAVGHRPDLLREPTVRALVERGFAWAAREARP